MFCQSSVCLLTFKQAIQSDAQHYFVSVGANGTEVEIDRGINDGDLTVYAREFGVFALDEASEMRRQSVKWGAMRQLTKRSLFMVTLTAPPIQNNVQVCKVDFLSAQ